MAIIPWLEDKVHGDKNFIKDIKKYGEQGRIGYGEGEAIFGEGLGGVRALDKAYSDRLAKGQILSPNVVQSFAALRGRVADTSARDTTDLNASLAQRNAQAGGRLSMEQMEELRKSGDQGIRDSEFEAQKDIGIKQAELELTETNRLQDRIEQARNQILEAGKFKQQLGQQAQIASILARLDRNKAIASTISSFFSFGR
jgi:hypothetical protein